MKLASLDLGLKRIGVAICVDGKVSCPLTAIIRKNRNQASRDVDKFLEEWGIEGLVVGVPKGGSSEEEMGRRIKHFISLLTFKGEIFYQDEYGTSYEAVELMVESQNNKKNRKDGKLDSISAKLILDRWLEFRN